MEVISKIKIQLKNPIQDYYCKTMKGFIKLKAKKENQDTSVVIQNYHDIKNLWLFGCCDGHGPNGLLASDYAIRKLPGKQ